MITLETLAQATAQEVFDQVKNHLLTQKEASIIDGVCLYKAPNGLKCAAGCLIGDDEYLKRFEGETWDRLVDDGLIPENSHNNLIQSLQYLHDNFSPQVWPMKLKEVAENYNLIYKDDEPTN